MMALALNAPAMAQEFPFTLSPTEKILPALYASATVSPHVVTRAEFDDMIYNKIIQYQPKDFARKSKKAREAYMIGGSVAVYQWLAGISGKIINPEVIISYVRDIAVEYKDDFLIGRIDNATVSVDYLQKYKELLFPQPPVIEIHPLKPPF